MNGNQNNSLIHGKCDIERIVSCEVRDNVTELFIENKDGSVVSIFKPNKFWILAPYKIDDEFSKMDGHLHYNYIRTFNKREDFLNTYNKYSKKNKDLYTIWYEKESAMVAFGFTYFKGMKLDEVSVLSFDIEATTLEHNKDAKVLLISNTFRKNGQINRKMFSYDEYETEAEFFDAWCEWVREVNPSIIIGHNIYMYDLPYMNYCAKKAGTSLILGRDDSEIVFSKKPSKFRKDGSQFYEYTKAFIYGREIIDTMFLAYKYDFSRKYENYRLKSIIKAEGLEIEDRQFYDADTIRFNYTNLEEWEKIKKYAEHDADDALALYDLMIASYFYLTQSIPKSFQQIITTAPGSQINSFLIRSYLQDFHSIPKITEGSSFEGAISIGNPGVYHNVVKVDIASLYPSIILQYQIYDKKKDPNQHFLQMVDYFTEERLENKKKAKETGDRYYKDLEQSQKIIINSAYGVLGAPLSFNSPYNASLVTKKGREILQQSIDWATQNGYQLVNADTDSISITRNGEEITKEEQEYILSSINNLYPEKIRFEDDGYFSSVLVIKAKNYVLKTQDNILKIKGSALKATMKESALKKFIKDIIVYLLDEKQDQLLDLYHTYIKEIYNLTSIDDWSSRKTITDKILNPERTNEQKVFDAIEDEEDLQEGDKIHVYFDVNNNLKLASKWDNDHNPDKLLAKLYATLKIFHTVINMDIFPKYHLKNHDVKVKLAEVLGLPPPEKVKRTRKKKENEIHQTI